jgi:hypothetical protein
MRPDAKVQWGFWSLIMPNFIDRAGKRFGRLVAVRRAGTDHLKKPLWQCICDCGNTTLVNSSSLSSGNTTSCGCYLKEKITKHGGAGKASYNTWRAMMRRCYNPKDKDFYKYGGKGIYVHAPWHDYVTFAKDVGEPVGDQTLDRIDPDGSYTPNNCRWASLTTQNRNIRMSKRNKSGIRGVLKIGPSWYAQITAKRNVFRSKAQKTIEAAIDARLDLERIHWGVS